MRVRPTLGLLTVLLLLIGGAGIYVVDRHQKNDAVERADAEAARLAAALDGFQLDATERLAAVDLEADPQRAVDLVGALRAELPRAVDVPEYGRERSSALQDVVGRRAALDERFSVAVDVLEEWATALPFIAAAHEALDADVPQRVVGGPVASGAPVRQELIPLMQRTKSEFEAVAVPAGQEALAQGVSAALQHVIDAAGTAAAELDAGRSASFTYGTEYRDALQPIVQYDAELRGRIESALAALAPGVPDEAAPEQVPVQPA